MIAQYTSNMLDTSANMNKYRR